MATQNQHRLISLAYLLPAAAALTLLDQLTKLLAVRYLKGQENLVLIPGVFELEYLENYGAAFGSFQGMRIPLIVLTLALLGILVWKYIQIPPGRRFCLLRVSLIVLTAGACGNLIDRIVRGYVVDFLYFTPINFPKFNVADCYVVGSVIVLAILLLFVYKEEEISFLFRIKA